MSTAFGQRLFVGTVAPWRRQVAPERQALHGAPPVYTNANVSIFDDQAAIVSSANLSGRCLRWDTEAGVLLNTAQEVGDLRYRVMAHWLPANAGPEYFALAGATEAWRRLAHSNAVKPADQRRGFILPYDVTAAHISPLPVVQMTELLV